MHNYTRFATSSLSSRWGVPAGARADGGTRAAAGGSYRGTRNAWPGLISRDRSYRRSWLYPSMATVCRTRRQSVICLQSLAVS